MAENIQPNYPSSTGAPGPQDETAVDLIRAKVARLYSQEPDVKQEAVEANTIGYRSRHQQFMYQLSNSGKDLATIQTEWHDYYQNLSAYDKHQVWQEFYESQSPAASQHQPAADIAQALATLKHQAAKPPQTLPGARSAQDFRTAIRNKVSASGQIRTKHHFQSLLFGLGVGLLAVLVFLFGFFNEVVIAPFIQPSRTAVATPMIISSGSLPATTTPEVIIPKINVEIPVDYSQTSTNETTIENALENGIVHYPTTVLPGQNGNTAFFGHSSNNIFNKGKYKFAFVLLHTLVVGDTFYLTNNNTIYAYKVISRSIVEPTDVSVLGPVAGQTATATLITCDPPGTSLHRLIVVGQQISPDPASNSVATTSNSIGGAPAILPGNGPTLWTRLMDTVLGKVSLIIVIIGALLLTFRWIYQPRRLAK